MLRRNSKKMNILLILICILLLGAVAFLFATSQKETKEVAQMVEESVKESDIKKEKEKTASDQKKEKAKKQKNEPKPTETPADVTPTPVGSESKAKGIVCWGDDLMDASSTATYSYMAVLQRLLNEQGYNLPVINKTIQGGGTLSMMKMAGVDDAVLQGYITAHEQAANGAELYITEKGIRDLTPEQTERNDLDCIPVIFMGYYGGWNHDQKELAEQQEHILKTFPDQEHFIVVGTRPVDGSVDSAALDQVLQEKWNEHYISLAQVTTYPASTIEAQEAMAQAIIRKMEELSYIEKSTQVNANEKTQQTP